MAARMELQTTSLERLQRGDEGPEQQAAAWILVGAAFDEMSSKGKLAKATIQAAAGPVLLVRGELPIWVWWMEHQVPAFIARYVPPMSREARRSLSETLRNFSKLDFEFIALLSASTFLAAFGLLQNSAAVIIGAMLIAPLMTPILGAGLSLAHGNRPLFRESLKTILIGCLAALLTSYLVGSLVHLAAPSILQHDPRGRLLLTDEMWSRTHPTWVDFLVGFVGGSAAAFARTRTHLADALAGAAIAAALVPPIATAGLQLSFITLDIAPETYASAANNLIIGPLALFVANMLTIMIGSSFVLWACGLRSDHSHSRRERWTTRMTALLLVLTAITLVWILQHP
jgi:uncharacterized hydrophobic protein (TIGR00271 family)